MPFAKSKKPVAAHRLLYVAFEVEAGNLVAAAVPTTAASTMTATTASTMTAATASAVKAATTTANTAAMETTASAMEGGMRAAKATA